MWAGLLAWLPADACRDGCRVDPITKGGRGQSLRPMSFGRSLSTPNGAAGHQRLGDGAGGDEQSWPSPPWSITFACA
jgi:hypothetical protein